MALNTFAALRAYVLSRGDEQSDDTDGDFYDITTDLAAQVQRDIIVRHPWLDLRADPPGAFVLTADITSLTLTVASTGTGVSGTLSATYASSLAGYKVRPTGKQWIARITDHTAGTDTVTLDAVPETLAANATTIFKDEYDLASDLGVFVDGLRDQDGHFIRLVSEEELNRDHPDPPGAGSVPTEFCRLTRTKVRLSHYPTAVRRIEYAYLAEIDDPSGSGTLTLPPYLRPALAEGMLALLYEMKLDRRQQNAEQRYEFLIERAVAYETRRVQGLGLRSNQMRQGPYGEASRASYGW